MKIPPLQTHRRFGGRLALLALLSLPLVVQAQTQANAPYEIAGEFSYLTNSYNGVPGATNPLLGWDASVAFPAWHNLRFVVDVSGYDGTNAGATQQSFLVLGGAQYEHTLGRERLFAHALLGDVAMNRHWGPNALPGATASFAEVLGGGLDTQVSSHFAFRVEADMQHSNLYLVRPPPSNAPYTSPGLPRFFGRFSTGVVWVPRLAPSSVDNGVRDTSAHARPASDLTFESLNSFGHYHVFGITWWSYLNVAGLEYDRNSWGRFIGARVDYAAEILPVVILRQPTKTDVWGNNHSGTARTAVPGLGISPIGMRLLWRDHARFKPYYAVKGGMIGFTHKAVSNYASYENFSLQQDVGFQLGLTEGWDLRAGVADFHFSNGFVVPNNPGIDEMMWMGGLTYHLGSRGGRL